MRVSVVFTCAILAGTFCTFLGEACTPFGVGLVPTLTTQSSSLPLSSTRVQTVTPGGGFVNSTSFWQDPTDDTLFFGRKLLADGASFQLWTFRLDLTAGSLTPIAEVAPTQFTLGDGRVVSTAYDSSVAIINGERVIAFECAGPSGFAGSTASCIGALDANNKLVIASTAVIVDGVAKDPAETLLFSASVPKLMVEGASAQLFWTQVRLTRAGVFQSIKTWSAPIAKGTNGFYWLAGLTSAAPSDSTAAVEIWGVTQPPMADVSQVVAYPNHYLVAAHAGDAACTLPSPARAGCYYMKLGWAPKNLSAGDFDLMTDLTGLPEAASSHIVQYPRFFRDPRGGTSLMFAEVDSPVMTIWPLSLTEPPVATTTAATATPSQLMLTKLFSSILGRPADAATLNQFANSSCYVVGRTVAESDEAFTNHYNSMSNSAFVTFAYETLFAREPDASGQANWTSQLDGGAYTRAHVLEDFLQNAEYKAQCVRYGLTF